MLGLLRTLESEEFEKNEKVGSRGYVIAHDKQQSS